MLEVAVSGILLFLNCGFWLRIFDLKVIWNVNIVRRVLELIKVILYVVRFVSL